MKGCWLKVISQILPKIGCHGNIPWDIKKEVQINHLHQKRFHSVKRLQKLVQRNLNASKPNERNILQFRHNFHFLPHLKTTEPIFTIFTPFRAISGAINACIRKTTLHFISEYESEEWRRSILTLAKIAQNQLVTIATTLGLLWNLCQFYNPHIYIYQHWNIGKDWFSSCWDIRRYRPILVESQHNFHFLPHLNSKTTEPIFTIFYTM